MEMVVWNAILSALGAIMVMVLKAKSDENKELRRDLADAKLDLARNYVPRIEFNDAWDKLTRKMDDGFTKLDIKLDKLIEAKLNEK